MLRDTSIVPISDQLRWIWRAERTASVGSDSSFTPLRQLGDGPYVPTIRLPRQGDQKRTSSDGTVTSKGAVKSGRAQWFVGYGDRTLSDNTSVHLLFGGCNRQEDYHSPGNQLKAELKTHEDESVVDESDHQCTHD